MISWKELKERRITQIVLTYVVGGWVAVTVFGEVIDRGVLSELVYRIVLVAYLGGIPAALIVGWFHGEKGSQKVTIPEVLLLGVVGLFTIVGAVAAANNYRTGQDVAILGLLDSEHDPRRVAVLYFDDLSGEGGDLGPVADGLTEGLIGELDRVRELDVISRYGVEPYRGRDVTPDSVGRALDAGSVIDGSVEQSGDHLRVSVRLIDTESGVDLDRTSFTIPVEQLLAARDSLVSSTARFLRQRLGEEVRIRERRAETASPEAWTHIQRAERLRKEALSLRQNDPDQALALLVQADSLLRTAEALDPEWTAPLVIRAELARNRGIWTHESHDKLAEFTLGVDLASRAIEREPNNSRAWAARGMLRRSHYLLNASPTQEERAALLDLAESDLETAVGLDDTPAAAMSSLSALYLYDRGESLSGALMARRALDADAYLRDADSVLDGLFWAHYDLGQFEEAGRTCTQGAVQFPDDYRFTQCALWMLIAPGRTPDPTAAWELLARVDSLTPPDEHPFEHSVSQMIVGGVLARANQPDRADSVLVAARAGPEVDPGQDLPGYEAIMRVILEDFDGAVQQLRRYASANPDHIRWEVEGELHWWWRPLRDNPDFQSLVAR